MERRPRVLSVYEGFFSGGARALHSTVVAGLQAGGVQPQSVMSIHEEVLRETVVQRMADDRCYRDLTAVGVPVTSLGRRHPSDGPAAFTPAELAHAASQVARADVVLSLKEQPLHLLNRPDLPRRPVIVCLHRSDPEHQGSALAELRAAIADGRIAACVCCAESTRAAYAAAGVPDDLLHVIPNGVDLARFRPPDPAQRAAARLALGVPSRARTVLLAARYHPMKNVPLFLAAARRFLGQERRGHVLLCGAGMSAANAELCGALAAAFADRPRLLRRVRLLGVRADMPTVYAAADVVALTSSYGEAAPLCLIEGAMCGAVPVATDVGDTAAIIDGRGLVTAADPAAVSAAWIEAVRRRTELGVATQRGREQFSATRMIAAYAALVERTYHGATTSTRR